MCMWDREEWDLKTSWAAPGLVKETEKERNY